MKNSVINFYENRKRKLFEEDVLFEVCFFCSCCICCKNDDIFVNYRWKEIKLNVKESV